MFYERPASLSHLLRDLFKLVKHLIQSSKAFLTINILDIWTHESYFANARDIKYVFLFTVCILFRLY